MFLHCQVREIPKEDAQYKPASRGVFLNEPIQALKPGTILLEEKTPLIEISVPDVPDSADKKTRRASYNQQVADTVHQLADLSKDKRAAVLRLTYDERGFEHNQKTISIEVTPGTPAHLVDFIHKGLAIFRNNATTILHKAFLFEHFSMFNHSCRPNLQFDVQTKPGSFLWRYIGSASVSQAKRQEKLSTFNFTCHCPSCENPKVSDPRRKQLHEWYQNRFLIKPLAAAELASLGNVVKAAVQEELYHLVPLIYLTKAIAHYEVCNGLMKKSNLSRLKKEYKAGRDSLASAEETNVSCFGDYKDEEFVQLYEILHKTLEGAVKDHLKKTKQWEN